MNDVLVAYATKHGSTHEVARALAEELRTRGLTVDVRPAADVREVASYAGVVVGGALYMGRWHRDARRLLSRFRAELAAKPVAIFAMGPLTTSEKDMTGARGQLDNALAHTPEVEPAATAIFGGVVRPEELHFPFSHMPRSDARDWDAILAWAGEVADVFSAVQVPAVHA